MGKLIAIAGKGGVGKSTFSALAIRYLLEKRGPILAVDADPNSNLPTMLGLKPKETIGQVLEDFMSAKLTIPQGISKQQWLNLRLNQAITESKGLDLIVMGRPEGPGCYCSANAVLRDFLDQLRGNYQWVVVDNEAGMEHLSRRTEGRIDQLILISDGTVKGIRTVGNILELIEELKLEVRQRYLVINRVETLLPALEDMIKELKIEFLGLIPEDKLIMDYDLKQLSLLNLPESSPAVQAEKEIMERILNKEERKAILRAG